MTYYQYAFHVEHIQGNCAGLSWRLLSSSFGPILTSYFAWNNTYVQFHAVHASVMIAKFQCRNLENLYLSVPMCKLVLTVYMYSFTLYLKLFQTTCTRWLRPHGVQYTLSNFFPATGNLITGISMYVSFIFIVTEEVGTFAHSSTHSLHYFLCI